MRINQLTDREVQMLKLLVEGRSSAYIAEKVGLTGGTTRVYLHDLYRRLGVENKTQAAVWYLKKTS
jgi:DNA-binding NarL/FixJ family response regulator